MKSCYLQQYGWTLRILCLANKSKTATIACHSYVESKKQPTTTKKNKLIDTEDTLVVIKGERGGDGQNG